MTPNPYRSWLLGITIGVLSVGAIAWIIGYFTSQGPYGAPEDQLIGLGVMAWGGEAVRFGVLLLALWLVVSALLSAAPPTSTQDRKPASERRRGGLGGNIDLR
jgi:uncharacterized BrkB/YihY/UPF0761 family membrane protein